MKKIGIQLLLVIAVLNVKAQDASIKGLQSAATTAVKTEGGKTDKNGWTKGGLVSINLTQVANSNWVASGGDKFSLSTAAAFNLFATKSWEKYSWANTLDLNYGLVKTTTLGTRKVNDRIDLISKFGYAPEKWKNVKISLLGQFRSQLTSGYDYDYFGSGIKRRISGFFAPAYITIAPGIDWTPKPWLSVFASPVSTRWTIVSNRPYSYVDPYGIFNGNKETPLATLYGVDPQKGNKGEFGAFVTVSAKKEIFKNVTYNGKIDLYSNYLSNPQNIDVFWTNQFLLKVNKWLNVTYQIDLLYDDDIRQKQTDPLVTPNSVGLQVLSTLGVGFTAKF